MSVLPKTIIKKSALFANKQLISGLPFNITACLCLALFISYQSYAEPAKSKANSGSSSSQSRIVKWKDENGVTHYGDKIPPQYANRENSLMTSQGITVQHNKPGSVQDKAADLEKIEQDKKDKALLGTFTNAGEIDLTRDRNLEPDLLALKNLQQDRVISQKKFNKASASLESYNKAKRPVPESVGTEYKTSKAELAKIDLRISERQQAIDAIRKKFDDDKKRYLTLRNQSDPTAGTAPVASTGK